MPIENECKLLMETINRDDFMWWLASHPEAETVHIHQHYLENGVRIRSIDSKTGQSWLFTYKKRIGNSNIEIETPISQHDFDALKTQASRSLTKARIRIPDKSLGMIDYVGDFIDVHWDVDFFHDDDEIYLILAEVELPADCTVGFPPVHPLLKSHTLGWIDKRDTRFDSYNLCDKTLAAKSLQEILDLKK